MPAITAKIVHEFKGDINGITTTNEELHLAFVFLLESMEIIFKIKTFDQYFVEDFYYALEAEWYNREALTRQILETDLIHDMIDVENTTNPKQALSNLQFNEMFFTSFEDINKKLKDQAYNFIFKD